MDTIASGTMGVFAYEEKGGWRCFKAPVRSFVGAFKHVTTRMARKLLIPFTVDAPEKAGRFVLNGHRLPASMNKGDVNRSGAMSRHQRHGPLRLRAGRRSLELVPVSVTRQPDLRPKTDAIGAHADWLYRAWSHLTLLTYLANGTPSAKHGLFHRLHGNVSSFSHRHCSNSPQICC
jgi:hypothetical protein